MVTVTIIGVGRLGGALALALPVERYSIDYLVVRDIPGPEQQEIALELGAAIVPIDESSTIVSDIVLITTQDDEIGSVAASIAEMVSPHTTVFHTSGSLSSHILEPIAMRGCSTGSIHPLVSVTAARYGSERFPGSYFCLEGDERAVKLAHSIVEDLGGLAFSIQSEKKALYHAAAVMASGHLVALTDISTELASRCGLDRAFAASILQPLVDSTVKNIGSQGTARSLTGTFARADVETFDRHVDALTRENDPNVLEIYLMLGSRSLDLASEQGADADAIVRMRNRIAMAKAKLR